MTRISKWLLVAALTALLALGGLVGLWQLSKARDLQLFGKLVSHVETSDKVIALTFDDGPTARYTPEVLALLREKDVKATFFLIGQEVERNPDQTRAILADGHEVGNHTYSHPDMTLAGWDTAAREVERADAAIRQAGYAGEILFRPPFGKKLVFLPLYLSRNGRTTVTWNIEPESHPEIAKDPKLIAKDILDRARPGSIVILHVMYASRETSRQALPEVIDGLRERGYRFVTVSELIEVGAHT